MDNFDAAAPRPSTPADPHSVAPPRTDADVPDYLEALGIPGLADIHIHFLPQNVLDKVWAYFDDAESNYGQPWPIHYRFDTDTRLQIVRDLGVRAIPALTYPHRPGMAAWLNDWNAEFAAAHDDVIHCATLYAEPEAADYVPAALDAGARLFKIHVQVGGFSPDDRVLDPAWAALAEAQVPIVIHAGSRPLPGTYTGPEAVANVLERFPTLRFVIAHMGMPEYNEFASLAEDYSGVHLDTTMYATGFLNSPAEVDRAYRERLVGLQNKIVLGSDFPNIPYPYARQISGLAELGLGDDWMASVLWHNGARLLGLDD
ncbi:amidohydrolase family protein [Brevibacterium sp. ZH18]|uniref:amidohydrolase family protein n=1 Tax=Brevibacterium sp. ZH18 TaxID=2927784 RepID=UPI001F60F0A2|nr:amidohydrolase family protein [Brevibacterium sp. ZH18]MCI4011242.1 amidohydrolase [Brevibacterium sp. ZH18]